jgi:hypothetical protein
MQTEVRPGRLQKYNEKASTKPTQPVPKLMCQSDAQIIRVHSAPGQAVDRGVSCRQELILRETLYHVTYVS